MKAALSLDAGADHAVGYEDFADLAGRAAAVYDSVGRHPHRPPHSETPT